MITTEQIGKCVQVARRYGAGKLALFGSAAEDPKQANDIDLICSGVHGWKFLLMGADMEIETGVAVDTVSSDEPSAFVEINLSRGKVLYER